MSTRQQRWAKESYELVVALKDEEAFAKKYRSYARSLPSLLQQSGLIQGLIFTQTRTGAQLKGQEVGKKLIEDLAQVYGHRSAEALIKEIQNAKFNDYLRLSEDLISLAVWFRRYTTALLTSDEDDAQGDQP